MGISNDPAAIIMASQPAALEALKTQARTDPQGAVKETARQFEALLMNAMLKSMRETVSQDGLFDSEQTRLYTSMLDEQLSQSMSRKGIGLAAVLERQLSASANAAAAGKAIASPTGLQSTPPADAAAGKSPPPASAAAAFIEKHAVDAQAVSRQSGIPARYMLGQAALETGWGRSEMVGADGTASHNLFGIKAGAGWQGKTVDVLTTEFSDGVAQKKVQTFRAYDSYRDSFRDYATLLAGNPRYAQALKNTGDAQAFARGLQQAGYATDPHYAEKLADIIEGSALRRTKAS